MYSWNDSLPSSSTFSGPALHEWIVLGIRGAIDLAPRPTEPQEIERWSGGAGGP